MDAWIHSKACMPAPFALTAIDHVVLRVRDMPRMRRFYCEALGCTVDRWREDLGLLQLRAGTSLIDLVDVDGTIGRQGGAAPGEQGHNMDHVCLRVESYDEDVIKVHLMAHGATIGEAGTRYGAQGSGPSLYLHDPEGNMLELKATLPAETDGGSA
jgi:glyoxylase I family protein